MAASCFVDVPEEEINLMKENAIPRNTKHATKFGMTLFKIVLNATKTPFNSHEIFAYIDMHEQSTISKKMAAVHFTTIPCEPN